MRTRLLLTIVLASLLAGYAGWRVARDFRKAEACERGSELGWLQAEFRLDDTAVARIGQLQRRFEEECEVHCEQVRQARALMATKPGDDSKARLEASLLPVLERGGVPAAAAAMQHSAAATARPPSLRSWAERTRPAAIAWRRKPCTERSSSRSISGGRPVTAPCTRSR